MKNNYKFDILKDRNELIEVFKWFSNGVYNGKYPNFQLQGTPNNIKLHFQRFFGEEEFKINDWLINGVNYIREIYGYGYGCEYSYTKPVSISFEVDNTHYDAIANLLYDEEIVIVDGKSPKNSNKKIMKTEVFDKIENVLGLKVNNLSIEISKLFVNINSLNITENETI